MSGPATILVVDDVTENRALVRATLEDEGYLVIEARDGAAGIAAFEEHHPACIVMDVRMPGIDGLVATRHIRALPAGEDVAIVFTTAQRELETFERAVAAGGDDFLTKPLRPDELVTRVEAAIHGRRLRGERRELVDQLRQQREQLQRLQYQKEQLSSYVVHDLKNPVSAIALQAQRILRDPTANERARSAATAIRDETRSLMRMITNLLDVSRADEGRLLPATAAMEPRAIVQEVVEELSGLATEAGVQLTSTVELDEWLGDRALVQRVIANLVENAIRHTPFGTAVTISLVRTGEAMELRVRDHGAGVPEERRASVFDRYATSEHADGHHRGLGLTFCKLAVEAHGGRIWIESGRPGAVVCASFPDAAR